MFAVKIVVKIIVTHVVKHVVKHVVAEFGEERQQALQFEWCAVKLLVKLVVKHVVKHEFGKERQQAFCTSAGGCMQTCA